MAGVSVDLSEIGPHWAKACKQAVADLNVLFKRKGIDVVLAAGGSRGPTISVKTDPDIAGTAVHGRTSAETNDSGQLLRAEVRLPVKVVINTPGGMRDAGPGILEVIVAHEFVHALGHEGHNSHLMAQTMTKMMGDSASGDKLQAGGTKMPPLDLAPESVEKLKAIWG
jgi:predicted Zn-dependent protease